MVASLFGLIVGLTLVAVESFAGPIDHRPANFFSVISEKDKSICGPILQSLNKEHRLPTELYDVGNSNLITDLLLTSDLEVSWERVKNDKIRSQLDYASVDLANDGNTIPVVRWDFSDRMGYRNELILPSQDELVASENSAPEDIVRTLSGQNARNVLNVAPQSSDFWTVNTYPSGGFFNFNIVKVGDRAFILGAASQAAERTVTEGGGFNAFVMEFHSMQSISVICYFHGGDK